MNETPALQLDTNLVRVAASGQSSNQGDTLKEEVNTNPIAVLDGRSIHLRQREPTPKSG